ncbi:MAG: DUF882 domain-containing protein [Pseudomonadota bacterium]
MTDESTPSTGLSRRALLGAWAGIATLAAAPVYANAPGLLRGAGDIRRIAMYSERSGESIDAIYWVDGEYIPEVMDEVAFLMRDWRQNEMIEMDPKLIDVMSASHNIMETDEPYQLMSGYRTVTTNNSLRRSNVGVARNSYHTKGMAADLRLRSRSSWQMYNAALSCRAGGVGRYRSSGFVHYDCGPQRSWQR